MKGRKTNSRGPYPIVYVEWTDAWSEDGWKEVAEVHANKATAKCETIGYLVREEEEFIYIASTISQTQVACCMVVPKNMIKVLTHLSIKPKKLKVDTLPVDDSLKNLSQP